MWSFGDGAEATGPDVRHQFAAPGRHTVTLTATDGVGEKATASRVVEVAAPELPVPVAPVVDRSVPVLSGVRVSPRRVRRGRSATVRFTSSDAAAEGLR